MRFFRHTAFLLPSAFLLGVLLFLLTHGRADAGFGTYPFFEAWGAQTGTRSTPEFRFLEQSLVFFLPLYLVSLLFVLCIAAAETALYGARRPVARSAFDRAFRKAFPALYMVSVAVLVLAGDRLARAYAPGALVTPVLVALAPFLGAALAILPAFLFAVPASAVTRAAKT
ncbi:MAG: hypothetical protein ABI610_06450 [Acidobacteriota bacterium]